MPVVELNGIEIAYEVVGEGQPWILTPGGRFTKEVGGLPEMAAALAARGKQVITWDRPNCGASSVVFRGPSESEVQAEALGALLRHLDVGPTVIVGVTDPSAAGPIRLVRNDAYYGDRDGDGLGNLDNNIRPGCCLGGGVIGLVRLGRAMVAREVTTFAAWGGDGHVGGCL